MSNMDTQEFQNKTLISDLELRSMLRSSRQLGMNEGQFCDALSLVFDLICKSNTSPSDMPKMFIVYTYMKDAYKRGYLSHLITLEQHLETCAHLTSYGVKP
jgi:hypothetical protein